MFSFRLSEQNQSRGCCSSYCSLKTLHVPVLCRTRMGSVILTTLSVLLRDFKLERRSNSSSHRSWDWGTGCWLEPTLLAKRPCWASRGNVPVISAPQEAGDRDETSLSSIAKPCHKTNQTPPKTDLQVIPVHSMYTSQPLPEGVHSSY